MLAAAFGGGERQLAVLASRSVIGNGSVLVLVIEDPYPTSDVPDVAVRLWHLVSLDAD